MILPSSVGRGGRRMVVRVERGGERVSEGRDGRGVGELAVKEGAEIVDFRALEWSLYTRSLHVAATSL